MFRLVVPITCFFDVLANGQYDKVPIPDPPSLQFPLQSCKVTALG